jgi:hypothetical protein
MLLTNVENVDDLVIPQAWIDARKEKHCKWYGGAIKLKEIFLVKAGAPLDGVGGKILSGTYDFEIEEIALCFLFAFGVVEMATDEQIVLLPLEDKTKIKNSCTFTES